jgi:hypothetical protein
MTETTDKPDPFETAEFYTCNEDQEILTLESWEEAIAEVVDDLDIRYWQDLNNNDKVDDGLVAAIRHNGPITVYAHSRETVTDAFVERQAERALEHIAEDFGENYGDPDNYEHDFDDGAVKLALPAMISAIRAFLSHASVWRCEKVGERIFTPDEVEALMREHNPDWFDPVPEALP